MGKNGTITLEIDGKEVKAPEGVTVLRAAELNGIYIPTLCSHKDLSPFGGCRLCIVEIEGMRGYPLSCYTIAKEGMKVKTDTSASREIRREVLQLILSEHPSSCLICGESDYCRDYMGTIRKSGVTTGCRFCPNDGQCELQEVVEKLGVHEINYPVLYKGYEPERDDPFYDRDYNLCILCGRCVRMCQEMRGTAVLAFNFRGPKAVVGPAFGRNHIEAGCEFCGACVQVCPTGALSEKASKWDGKPDGYILSACPYCAIGCTMEFYVKNGRFSKSLPSHDPEVNDGQACLKGRFCVGEVSHHFDRARKPVILTNGRKKEVLWEEAIEKTAEELSKRGPNDLAVIISPDLSLESLYVAQKFVRLVLGTTNFDSTARYTLKPGLWIWEKLFARDISINSIKDSKTIISVGIDTRFNFSVVGVEIRKALNNGAELIAIDSQESNLTKYTPFWLKTYPGFEGKLLLDLVKGEPGAETGADGSIIQEAASKIKESGLLTIVIGPTVFMGKGSAFLAEALEMISNLKSVNIIPLYHGANTRGLIEAGCLPEILPGGFGIDSKEHLEKLKSVWGAEVPEGIDFSIEKLLKGEFKPKLLYLIGANPLFERDGINTVIAQDIFKPLMDPEIFLPATSFLEEDGLYINVEGRIQKSPKVEDLPDSVMFGRARPDWWILSRIAEKLGKKGFEYKSVEDIRDEIGKIVPDFGKTQIETRKKRKLSSGSTIKKEINAQADLEKPSGFTLLLKPGGYTHRGVDIRTKVEGLQILNPEFGFYLNPMDAENLNINDGDEIIVKAGEGKGKAKARISEEVGKGTIVLYVPDAKGGVEHLKELESLYNIVENPCPAEVKKNGV